MKKINLMGLVILAFSSMQGFKLERGQETRDSNLEGLFTQVGKAFQDIRTQEVRTPTERVSVVLENITQAQFIEYYGPLTYNLVDFATHWKHFYEHSIAQLSPKLLDYFKVSSYIVMQQMG